MGGLLGRKGSNMYNRKAGCLGLMVLLVLGMVAGDAGCTRKKKHRSLTRPVPAARAEHSPAPPAPRGPRFNAEMVVNQDAAAWATQEQAAVFEGFRMEGDTEMMKFYGEARTNEGNCCLMKRGERVRVFEVSAGAAWIRVRREGSTEAWWVDARALDGAQE